MDAEAAIGVQKSHRWTGACRVPISGLARVFVRQNPFKKLVMANRATRKEAVYRVLLIHEDFEHGIQLYQHNHAQTLDSEAGKLHCTAGLLNLRVTEKQWLQCIGVDAGYFREVEYDIHSVGFDKGAYRGTERRF
jgi:hypothetical protein